MSTDPLDDGFTQQQSKNRAIYFERTKAWWWKYHGRYNFAIAIVSIVLLYQIEIKDPSINPSNLEEFIGFIAMNSMILFFANILYLGGFIVEIILNRSSDSPLQEKHRRVLLGAVVVFMFFCLFLLFSLSLMPT